MAYLRLCNVAKSYDGKTHAVDNISIDIARGEFVTLLGPSGSGKTTTLLLIAGFEYPSDGAIELAGADLSLRRPYERNIGMVFQNYALFPHMTAVKNVMFPLRMRRFPRRERHARAQKMLELVGLGQFADRHPRELSGGQQQRVALARGLVFNPDVLLLDEPLGALDKNLREQMQLEIKRIHRELGITMVYVTHDQTEAMTMSDRIAVFRSGAIEQVGSPLDVYNRPVNRFVGEFIGESNFLPARVDRAHPDCVELIGIGSARVADKLPAAGTDLLLMIRPERLRLQAASGPLPYPPPTQPGLARGGQYSAQVGQARLAAGEGREGVNEFEMRLDDVINYGDSILLIGTTRGQPLRARIAGNPTDDLRRGLNIKLAWSPGDAHILPT